MTQRAWESDAKRASGDKNRTPYFPGRGRREQMRRTESGETAVHVAVVAAI